MDINEYVKKIQSELLKLKDVEDDKVKEVYSNVETLLSEMVPKEKETKEEKKEDKTEAKEEAKETEEEPEKAETTEEEVEEKAEVEEEKTEETTEDEETKELNAKIESKDSIILSDEVSSKLKEAAVELANFEKTLVAKDEVINTYKVQVAELSAELDKYRDAEKIELDMKFDRKVSGLIELYASLGIKKEMDSLKEAFNEEQIDKLIVDLSAMKPKRVSTASGRKTPVSVELELKSNDVKPHKLTDAEIATTLFGLD